MGKSRSVAGRSFKIPREAEKARNLRHSAMLFWLIPCLAALCLYLGALRFGFLFDDHGQIEKNPQIQSWDYLPRLLTTHVWSQKAAQTLIPQYRPVFSVWLLLVYSLVGGAEWAWHATNLALYALCTYLVYRLALEVLENRLAAAAAALLFAVHPIHIEAVCWVSACNELLLGVLVAASLLHFHRALRQDARPFWNRWTLLSLLAWTAALFTKESILPVVAVFPFLAWRFTNPRSAWKPRAGIVLRRTAPYLVAVPVYLAIRLAVLGKMGLGGGSHNWAQVAYSAPSLFTFYMRKLVVPTGLSSFYLNPLVSSPSAGMWLLAGTAISGIALLGWLGLRREPVIGVAGILLLAPLLPVMIAVKMFLDGETAHDRYLFVPSIGLCLLAGAGLKVLLGMSRKGGIAVLAATLAIVICLAALTEVQEGFYRDEKAFFGRALEIDPGNVLIMDYLGNSYLREFRNEEALELYWRAHSLKPNDFDAAYCLARGLYKSNHLAEAESQLENLSTSPGLSRSQRFKSSILLAQDELRLERPETAVDRLEKLVQAEPNAPGVHLMLGSIYQVQGHLTEAQNEYLLENKISGNSAMGHQAFERWRTLAANPAAKWRNRGQKPTSLEDVPTFEKMDGVE